MEAAYKAVVVGYTKAGKDDEATAAEEGLKAFKQGAESEASKHSRRSPSGRGCGGGRSR